VRHVKVSDKLRERAALYALGSLAPQEARAFALHLEGGCPPCRAEVESFAAVGRDLALAPDPVPPRPEVRARLLGAASAGGPSPFHFLARDEGEWEEIQPGVHRKDLGGGRGSTSYLIRMAPGTHVATHRHAAVEHCYVVDGDLRIAGRHIHAGDYHRADRDSTHEAPATDGGCLLLIVESPA
jgi:anti-sigma factor ChrR (cupin superfamily)